MKHFLLGNVEKVKDVGSHRKGAESNTKEEANYLHNQGVFGPVVKETKVGTIMEIGRIKVTGVDCMYLLKAMIMLPQVQEKYPWRT